MSLEKNFCPSPWFHMRINNSGSYEYCRWSNKTGISRLNIENNISNLSPLQYFQNNMSRIRQQFLDGDSPAECIDCRLMEQHNKVSGRQRQLLKVGVFLPRFDKSLASSPLKSSFDYSVDWAGKTDRTVSDWQIDLGNYCNSACVFCHPESSSRLASEYKQLGLIDQLPNANWCDNKDLLQKFINDLESCKDLKYLHFIGGETTVTPAFKTILESLINIGLHKQIAIGFTTNLTTWPKDVIDLLIKFQTINLGVSVETFTELNDYVRWPSKIDQVKKVLEKWIQLKNQYSWYMQLRITPTCLTVHELDTVYEYAWTHQLAVESCNFINDPEFFQISVLPTEQRQFAYDRLSRWIRNHQVSNNNTIINTRDPTIAHQQVVQDAQSYLEYLKNAPDESYRLPNMVKFLKKLESNRGNSILTYIPDYENILRSAGY
jgi:hypothetical protein